MGKKNFITDFHIVYSEDHPVLFGLSTLTYLSLFVKHPPMFIEKRKPVHMIKGSDTQTKESLQELERPLEVLKVGDIICSTPASVDLCQWDVPKIQEWHQLMPKQSKQRHGSCGKSAYSSINVDTCYHALENVYVPGV